MEDEKRAEGGQEKQNEVWRTLAALYAAYYGSSERDPTDDPEVKGLLNDLMIAYDALLD